MAEKGKRKIVQVIETKKEKLGISWSAMAEKCGVDEATLHRLRADAAGWDPLVSTLERIAEGLNISPREFWTAK